MSRTFKQTGKTDKKQWLDEVEKVVRKDSDEIEEPDKQSSSHGSQDERSSSRSHSYDSDNDDDGDSRSQESSDSQSNLPWYQRIERSKRLLKSKPGQYEKTYSQKEAEQCLKDALFDMKEFDFLVSTENIPKTWGKKDRPKRFRRIVHLRFICPTCDDKVFTSICGTLEASFWVQNLSEDEEDYDELEYPYLVKFETKIYRMQCETCGTYCVGKIYESHLDALQIQFAHIISEIVTGKPPPGPRKRKQYIPDNHHHKSEWCEACQEGLCMSQNIKKEWDKGTIRQNGNIVTDLDMHEIKDNDK